MGRNTNNSDAKRGFWFQVSLDFTKQLGISIELDCFQFVIRGRWAEYDLKKGLEDGEN
jgi:hypothetical protein